VLETDSTLLDLSWDDKKIHRIAMVMMLGRGIFVVHWIRIHCCNGLWLVVGLSAYKGEELQTGCRR